jgi:hypothetical protein
MSSATFRLLLGLLIAVTLLAAASAFQTPQRSSIAVNDVAARRGCRQQLSSPPTLSNNRIHTITKMASEDDGATKRRRRKRTKSDDADQTNSASVTADATPNEASATSIDETKQSPAQKQSAQALAAQLLSQERMMYDEDDLTSFTPQKLEEDDRIAAAASKAGFSLESPQGTQLEDLFDSREFLQRKREKQLEDQTKVGKPSSVIPTKNKIKRSDVAAYTKLLEMDPLADEDSSYFEDENEGRISIIQALLGDVEPDVGNDTDEASNKSGNRVQKKTSFLGIGSGPLQVGHFIGALGVVLMAFVEYPGFPLTNLPTPLRAALQGGLGTIYGINLVMAVIAALSAPGRNQPALLWAAKTFAVGGIAYDQLMQIPTPKELEERAKKEAEMNKLRGRGSRRSRM